MSFNLIWLKTSVTPKVPKVLRKATKPSLLIAPEAVAVWCSWMPDSKKAFSETLWNPSIFTEPSRSQLKPITLGTVPELLSLARSSRAAP